MSWQCRIVEPTKLPKEPGDVWFVPADVREATWVFLSNQYKRDWADKRLPIAICLPNGEPFVIDNAYRSATQDYRGEGWTVTGEAPNITVMPSINAVGRYHGWLRDGVLSDDVEGRTFK